MNYCGFNIEPFCSDVCGDYRRPQTLTEICRIMGIYCDFRAVAARGKYPGFMLLGYLDSIPSNNSTPLPMNTRHLSIMRTKLQEEDCSFTQNIRDILTTKTQVDISSIKCCQTSYWPINGNFPCDLDRYVLVDIVYIVLGNSIWHLGNLINIWFPWHNRESWWLLSNGNNFRVTGLLCEEFTGHRTKTSDAELWCFLWNKRVG